MYGTVNVHEFIYTTSMTAVSLASIIKLSSAVSSTSDSVIIVLSMPVPRRKDPFSNLSGVEHTCSTSHQFITFLFDICLKRLIPNHVGRLNVFRTTPGDDLRIYI